MNLHFLKLSISFCILILFLFFLCKNCFTRVQGKVSHEQFFCGFFTSFRFELGADWLICLHPTTGWCWLLMFALETEISLLGRHDPKIKIVAIIINYYTNSLFCHLLLWTLLFAMHQHEDGFVKKIACYFFFYFRFLIVF